MISPGRSLIFLVAYLRHRLGAREAIAAIRSRKSVTKLILSHNNLADYGCQELFRFLYSEGRHYRIAEVFLKSNEVGNIGLEAIAEYLVDNEYLKALNLQAVSRSEKLRPRHNILIFF